MYYLLIILANVLLFLLILYIYKTQDKIYFYKVNYSISSFNFNISLFIGESSFKFILAATHGL